MRNAGHGRIVMVSSAGAIRGMPAIGAYSAAKGAIERWAESLSQEMAPFGLGVSVLVAGTFRTDILELTTTYADYDGPYGQHHAGLESFGERFLQFASSPDRFGPAVAKALEDRRPFSGDTVGPDARLLMFGNRLASTNLLQRITCRAIGIPEAGALTGTPCKTSVSPQTNEGKSVPEDSPCRVRIADAHRWQARRWQTPGRLPMSIPRQKRCSARSPMPRRGHASRH